MKVALVHEWLVTFAGSEQVLKSISEIFKEAPIFVPVYNKNRISEFKNKEIHTSFIQKLPKAKTKPQLYLPLHLLAFERFNFKDYDLVISSSHAFAKGVITPKETLHICYCHYPLRYVWEPKIDPRLSTNPIYKGMAQILKPLDLRAAKRPDLYVANSKNTALKIKKHYGRDSKVIYPPVNLELFRRTKSPSKDYFLLAGRMIYYKNPHLVVEAFNQLGWKLKVIGSGPLLKKLKKMARRDIEFLGRVSDQKLVKLYANCKALVFPGEEDFGIIPVEVMASGRPILALARGGVTETVVRGKHGDFFKKPEIPEIIKALKKFDYNAYDPKTLRARAIEFETKRFKREFQGLVSLEYNKKRRYKKRPV